MATPEATRAFLLSEVEALEAFDFIAVAPAGNPLHVAEATRGPDGGLEVRVPGRMPMVPALGEEVLTALSENGFSSEDPKDSTKPWSRVASDETTAVDLLHTLRTEVFSAKADAPIDVAHGSHRAEHEAREKLAIARDRIEKIVADILGRPAERDDDGDYVLPIGQVHVMVSPRATPDGRCVVRVFAITNVSVNVTPELGLFLARLNFGQMFGRFALDVEQRSIWFDETLLGEQFPEDDLRFVIDMIAATADGWDDRLKQMFGGLKYQEVLAGRAPETPPSHKPGDGVGMYL